MTTLKMAVWQTIKNTDDVDFSGIWLRSAGWSMWYVVVSFVEVSSVYGQRLNEQAYAINSLKKVHFLGIYASLQEAFEFGCRSFTKQVKTLR